MESGGWRKTSPKSLLRIFHEDGLLKAHSLGVGENEGELEVEGLLVEHRKLAVRFSIFGIVALIAGRQLRHGGGEGGGILERGAGLAGQELRHHPGGLAFHHGEPRGGAVVALASLLDEAGEVVILIGQGVRELVSQHGRLALGRRGVGDEELLAVIVVESGGLFGEQVDFVLGEVEILRDEAELLECEFLGADLRRGSTFL